jgi:hypothetical protein
VAPLLLAILLAASCVLLEACDENQGSRVSNPPPSVSDLDGSMGGRGAPVPAAARSTSPPAGYAIPGGGTATSPPNGGGAPK